MAGSWFLAVRFTPPYEAHEVLEALQVDPDKRGELVRNFETSGQALMTVSAAPNPIRPELPPLMLALERRRDGEPGASLLLSFEHIRFETREDAERAAGHYNGPLLDSWLVLEAYDTPERVN